MIKLQKFIWWLKRKLSFALRYYWFKIFGKALLKSIGQRTIIFGKIRFGSAEGNIFVGDNCWLGDGVFFSASKGSKLVLGNHCSLNTGCHLVAVSGIEIGDNTRVGEYTSIRDQNQIFKNLDIPIREQGFTGLPIRIGKDVWIGRGVYIGPGVDIGDGCVIGANSVVNKSIEPYSVVAGVPARLIRKRKSEN